MSIRRVIGCFAVVVVFLGLAAVDAAAAGKKAKASGDKPAQSARPSADPDSANYRPDDGRAAGGAKREEMIASVEQQLDEQKVLGGKKDPVADLFVIGAIDLQNHQATVDYQVLKGLRHAAEWVADFMLGGPKGAIRKWHAYGRAKTEKAAQNLCQKAKADSFEGQLEAFRLNKPGKKLPDDTFVVGTAELFLATRHADIRFQVVKGTKAAASFLIDFILSSRSDTQRQWQVFHRAKTEDEANQYVQQMRNLYDNMEAERAKMAQIYNAKTTPVLRDLVAAVVSTAIGSSGGRARLCSVGIGQGRGSRWWGCVNRSCAGSQFAAKQIPHVPREDGDRLNVVVVAPQERHAGVDGHQAER